MGAWGQWFLTGASRLNTALLTFHLGGPAGVWARSRPRRTPRRAGLETKVAGQLLGTGVQGAGGREARRDGCSSSQGVLEEAVPGCWGSLPSKCPSCVFPAACFFQSVVGFGKRKSTFLTVNSRHFLSSQKLL